MLHIKINILIAFILGMSLSYISNNYTHLSKLEQSGYGKDYVISLPVLMKSAFAGEAKKENGIQLTSEEPPKYPLYKHKEIFRVFNESITDETWDIIPLNSNVLEKFPDIEAILTLNPPDPQHSNNQDWYKFAIQLANVKLWKRHQSSKVLSPLLIWYVYIAKYSPETIYTLFNDRQLNIRVFTHLIQFGFLEDWWKYTHNLSALILKEEKALLSIIFNMGDIKAKELYIRSFFEIAKSNKSKRIDVDNFLFALEGMNNSQKKEALELFKKRTFIIDPRHVELLKTTKHWQISDSDILSLIDLNAYKGTRRTMSSFFTAAAKYGEEKYFKMLLNDAELNDSQPTNFYCSACGLALISDGLLGTPLIEELNKGYGLDYSYNSERKEYIIEHPRNGASH